MKLEVGENSVLVDAEDLARLIGLPAKDVQAQMRAGEITTRFEVGQDVDQGKIRVSFFHAGKCYRLVCNEEGTVLGQSTFPAVAPDNTDASAKGPLGAALGGGRANDKTP